MSENESDNLTKMVLPCPCPHCGEMVIVALETPHPTAEIMTPESVPEDIKNLILNENDSTQESKATGFPLAQGDESGLSTGPETTD